MPDPPDQATEPAAPTEPMGNEARLPPAMHFASPFVVSPEVLEEAAQLALDPYARSGIKFIAAIDTDALLSSIDNQCRTGWPSRILRMAKSRVCRVYAADHVYGEVYDGFDKIAPFSTATSEELRECFEENYLPYLHWAEIRSDEVLDDRVLEVVDQTDVPTAQLACLIAPCVVLSEDRALRRPGFAPDEWRLAAREGAAIVESTAEQENILLSVAVPPVAVVAGGIKLGQWAKVPWWIALPLIGAGVYWVFSDQERRQTLGRVAETIMEDVARRLGEAAASEQASAAALKETLVTPTSPPTLKQQIATVLARSPMPLLATEVSDEITRCFADTTVQVAATRDCLRHSPEFVRRQHHHWQLGRASGPWREATA